MGDSIIGNRLFTDEEVDTIRSSWTVLSKNGLPETGLVLLHRFLSEVPEVRILFYKTDSEDSLPEDFSVDDLRERKKLFNHAKRLATAFDMLVNNLMNEDKFVKKCTNLGQAHRRHKVKPQYFDMLGSVIIRIIEKVFGADGSHATVKAWTKAYGIIADSAKLGLGSSK